MLKLHSLLRAYLDLVFPRSCVGCGVPEVLLCEGCSSAFLEQWIEVSSHLPNLFVYRVDGVVFNPEAEPEPLIPVFVLREYEGTSSSVIISWKHSNCPELDARILEVWQEAVRELWAELKGNEYQGGLTINEDTVIFVNAPSKFSRRHNGQLVAEKLAHAAAKVTGGKVFARPVLRTLGKSANIRTVFSGNKIGQREVLRKNQRQEKSQRIYVPDRFDLRGLKIVLVDDVVTTGATLAGSVAAIEKAGGEVLCALALAAASLPIAK